MLNIFNKPNLLLRIEGLLIFILAVVVYWSHAYSWRTFWYFILVPDIALFAYLINPNIGATAYNITHSKLLPSLLAIVSLVIGNIFLMSLSVIWFSHIGFDRFLGYGLKYTKGLSAID